MFYYIARFFLFVYLHIIYRIKVEGTENIPETGGLLLCSNHINNMDPLLVATSVKRKIHYMAKRELFENYFLKILFGKMGAFPVDREGNDLSAYKKAIDLLKGGNAMGIFVQGKRIVDADVKNAKSGAAFFALKSGAAIVPAFIKADYKPFGVVSLKIGKPLDLEKYSGLKVKSETVNNLTDEIIRNINNLSK